MPRVNEEVAAAFAELADLMELLGNDHFRVLAHRRVAETLAIIGDDLAELSEKELTGLRGIGKASAGKIREFLVTGTMQHLEDLRAAIPPGVREMTALEGLGPKRAMLIHTELGVATLEDLREAIAAGRVRQIKGMGAKTEENLLRALGRAGGGGEKRILIEAALETAESLVAQLRKSGQAVRVDYAGSLRRMRETIGDIDLLAAGEDPARIMDAFTSLEGVARVAARGTSKSTVTTDQGLQVDLRVVAPDEWGAALQYFTGSKDHNVKVREHAVKLGFKLSEYGLFEVDGGARIAAETEEEVYAALGMAYPPPTIREDKGEVELALENQIPSLIEVSDIRGDLHAHSTYSDGKASVAEMVDAAVARGYRYFALTDHGGSRWPLADKLDTQAAEIAASNARLGSKMKVLHGVEMSITASGGFAFSDEVLSRFDVVVASVHDALGQDRDTMTRRIIKAIEHPEVNILGHPTGRRINKRDPIDVDIEAVFRAAAANRVALEISGTPERLDLRDEHVRLARRFGCVFAINTDSHSPDRLARMRLGVGTAQRGWVAAAEVINTLPLTDLVRFFEKR